MGEDPDDRVIRSYLLGDLSAEERSAFQQRLFEDDEVFLRVLVAEDDLADALAQGELPADEAARVRTFLEESSQNHRLPIAQALARVKASPPRRSFSSTWRMLPLAACVLLAIAALWLTLRNRELQSQVAQVRTAPNIGEGVFAARIPAGAVRGSDRRPTLQIPAGARVVELRLEVRAPGNYPRYRVDVNRASGQAVSSVTMDAPMPGELAIAVSRGAISPGDYEIALSGLQADQSATPIEYYYCTFR